MNKLNFLQPDKNNLNTYLYTGIILVALSIFIVFLNSFFNKDLISFLPGSISFFLPLILGFIGLHLIRIDYSGLKFLDSINKNINTNNFNAFLSLLIVFVVIKSLPPLLSWFILDANIAGDSKDVCTGTGACWTYIKIWFNRFMYGMYPNAEQWRVNATFIIVLVLMGLGYFFPLRFKKYLTTGKSDLLPSANIIPIGKQKIKEKNETINVKDRPPHAPVSTHSKPNSPPDIK